VPVHSVVHEERRVRGIELAGRGGLSVGLIAVMRALGWHKQARCGAIPVTLGYREVSISG
jgi:hypothetical protein